MLRLRRCFLGRVMRDKQQMMRMMVSSNGEVCWCEKWLWVSRLTTPG
jgi:predicted RNA-binding protein YlxR (DUF448 family)